MPSYQYRIPMLKIRRSHDRLIFNMGIPYMERRSLYWNTALVQQENNATPVATLSDGKSGIPNTELVKTLMKMRAEYSGMTRSIRGCWWPGDARYWIYGLHVGPCLLPGRILTTMTTCTPSLCCEMAENVYNFVFLEKKSAWQEFRLKPPLDHPLPCPGCWPPQFLVISLPRQQWAPLLGTWAGWCTRSQVTWSACWCEPAASPGRMDSWSQSQGCGLHLGRRNGPPRGCGLHLW